MISEHKNLTKDEVKALMKHGLPAGAPSQLSDSFVLGMRYGKSTADGVIKESQRLTTDRENAISLMSPSWQHAASKEPDLMTRYVTMAENQFKEKNKEIERLTAIATKHATRADELYEVLECICSYLSEDGLITTGLAKEIVNAQRILNKSQIDAVSNSNDD